MREQEVRGNVAMRLGAIWGRYDQGAGLPSEAYGRAVCFARSGVLAREGKRAFVVAYREAYPVRKAEKIGV